mgnify:CR=1 FL=1
MLTDSNHCIAIRTYASSETGIGHLVRMRHLALALLQKKIGVLFLLDQSDSELSELLDGVDVVYLGGFISQKQDASQVIEKLATTSIEMVVVDDYRLDATWEAEVAQVGLRIVSIDDTATRSHQCDLLIDPKWRGAETPSGYQSLVPQSCRRLLGPDYVLLSEEYGTSLKKIECSPDNPFKVLFTLGGGGDLDVLADLLEALQQQPDYDANVIQLQAVVGPSSRNRQRLQQLAAQGAVELLVGKRSLFEAYCSASLVVGAAGGTVYELARLRVPIISFSMSENQQTPQSWLDGIGHYLHLPGCTERDIRRIAQLVLLVKGQYARVQQLFSDSKVQLDGRGAERVVTEICQLLSRLECSLQSPERVEESGTEESGYLLRPVGDRDINHYLQSRNLQLNRDNMIEEQAIRPIVHYRWWLQTRRDSFLLTKDGEAKLYIWQEIVQVLGRAYWIGGWFVCGEGCQYQDTLYALSRQLEWTDQHHLDIPWIAVISRENHFVKLLNQYQGFSEVEQESERGAVIAAAFPKASFDQFYFVTRDPQ